MSDDETKPSAIGWTITAWRDTAAAISQMPVVLGVGLSIIVVLHLLNDTLILPKPVGTTGFGRELLAFVLGVVEGFLVTPVALAVHRFVLLGERTANYRLEPNNPRFQRFFLFTVLLQFIFVIPSAVMGVGDAATGTMQFGVTLIGCVLIAYAIFVMLRTFILFPAIAVDAAGAEWGNALRDSKGYAWRTLLAIIAACTPIMVVYLPLFLLWWPIDPTLRSVPSLSVVVAFAVIEAVVMVLATIVYAALASRMFAALAERLAGTHGDGFSQR
jgi:hypothetical protein